MRINLTFIHKWADLKEGVVIGKDTIIGGFVTIESNAIIGDNVTIQPYSIICKDMVLEDNVYIAPHFTCANVKFISSGHHGQGKFKKKDKEEVILIGKNTRIGSRCSVAPGVRIGKDCFIKMNCNIYGDVPDNTIVYANTTWPKDYD